MARDRKNKKKNKVVVENSSESDERIEDPPDDPYNPDAFYEIECIIDHREKKPPHRDKATGRMVIEREYLIKWKKYDDDHNSWEPYENIKQDAPDSVHLYEEKQKKKRIENRRQELQNQKERRKREIEQLEEAKALEEAKRLEESKKLKLDSGQKVAPLKLKLQGNKLNPKIMENIDGTAKITSPRIVPQNLIKNSITDALSETSTSSSDNSSEKQKVDEKTDPQISPNTALKTTINLKKFSKSTRFPETRLVTEVEKIEDYKIFKVEPPNGQEPNQLIYLLLNPINRADYWRISSKNLQRSEYGKKMMCRWLEKLVRPMILKEIEAMKKMDRTLLYKIPLYTEGNPVDTTGKSH